MDALSILTAKRDGGVLSTPEIRYWVSGVTGGSIPDYQTAAWLMAVVLRGMNAEETLALTLAIRDSGERLDLSDLANGPAVDKHSTGGVGDKTTLVVVPMLAALGVPVLKMSGRGLGFSGGTVDKLESIPGFQTDISPEHAKRQVAEIGIALISQSARLAPADGVLYALRDVTATVESIPLIVSSIMSKKLAAGAGEIVLDVKVGRGAFMKTRAQAEELARALVDVGNRAGIPTSALLTGMEEPLGYSVGNALEVREAIDVLCNRPRSEQRFRSLCTELVAHTLVTTGRASSGEAARISAEHCLVSGSAAAKFEEMVRAQGGPDTLEETESALPRAGANLELRAAASGTVVDIDAEAIGKLAVRMGAGRFVKADRIDPAVGIVLKAKTGVKIQAGELLATLHLRASDAGNGNFLDALSHAYRIENPVVSRISTGSLVIQSIS